MNRLARLAFEHLYTTFARAYDAVASAVSFGEWRDWGSAATAFIPARARVLELAHGPGHLQRALQRTWPRTTGIDVSAQMGRIARGRVMRETGRAPSLARASGLDLPFADGSFDCVVSTFPTAFIYAAGTLREIRRVLAAGGRAVIVPGAQLTSSGPAAAAVRLAYRLTGQHPTQAATDSARRVFESAGFDLEINSRDTPRATVTIWVLTPRRSSP